MKSDHISIRLLAWLLCSLIFVSTTGLNIDMHFCKDRLRSLNFLGDAKSCVEKVSSCHKHEVKEIRKQCPIDCCSDKTVQVEGEDELFFQQIQKTSVELPVIGLLVTVYSPHLTEAEEYLPSPLVYKPPKIIRNIYTVLESFLL